MPTATLEDLAALDPAAISAVLDDLSEHDAQALYADELYRWTNWARPEQLPPSAPWRFWVCIAGRGGGKTRTGAEWVNDCAKEHAGLRIGLIGATKADVRDVMVEGESGILSCSPSSFFPEYEPSKRRVTWPNGSIAITYSADDPEQTRGQNLHKAWADELGKWKDPRNAGRITAWENLRLAVRLGKDRGIAPQILVTSTPRRVGRGAEIIKDLVLGKKLNGKRAIAPPTGDPATWRLGNAVVHRWGTDRNRGNLSDDFIRDLDENYAGTSLEAQERHGVILEEVDGALWRVEHIDPFRVWGVPRITRLLVSCDPSHSEDGTNDEAGIIVGALGEDGDVYIMDDRSLRGSPLVWGKATVEAHNVHRADGVVIEVTSLQTERKGHVVKDTIRAVDPENRIKWIEVHSSSDKRTRAEPVHALYEQGRVHHVMDHGRSDKFAALEDEMQTWDPHSNWSPNRLDALVHLITELKLKDQRRELRLL